MKDWNDYRKRFIQDALPTRLGGIAANLARINSFAGHETQRDMVQRMIEDSEFLIEWTAPVAELETQVELLELQRLLARWYFSWEPIWKDVVRRNAVRKEASRWSDRLLDLSGVLNEN